MMIEQSWRGKFEAADLESLRRQLLDLGADSYGASEVIQAFLHGRGFGVSPESARVAAIEFGRAGFSLDSIGVALERAAMVA